MNKGVRFLIVFSIIITILFSLWIIGRVTNALQFFTFPVTSNYPTIKNGDRFFASNLVTPKRFDFICFYVERPEFGRRIYADRLCGLEGDKIEIRNGILYVNDQNADENLSLAHNYFVPSPELAAIDEKEQTDESYTERALDDSVKVYLSDAIAKIFASKVRRQILLKDIKDDEISEVYKAPWNQDNFGPIIVPEGKYFVLGDNRMNAQDSRYLGFIDKSKYIATVLGKK